MLHLTPDQSKFEKLRRPGSLVEVNERELLVVDGSYCAWNLDRTVSPETTRSGLEGKLPDLVPERYPASGVAATSEEEVVWGGFISSHYGHFLAESVARLWPLLPGGLLEGRRVVYANQASHSFSRDWLRGFGVQTVPLPREGAVLFRKMHVPEAAIRMGSWVAPEIRDIHLHARSGLAVDAKRRGGVLWLSRTELLPRRKPYDELLFEWLMGDHITVLTPESLTLPEQIARLESSEVVVGAAGSAFHTLIMARVVPPRVFICGNEVPWGYAVQDSLLGGGSRFVNGLVAVRFGPKKAVQFPGCMRLSIPDTIEALAETVLPELLEDPRIAAVLRPRRTWSGRGGSSEDGEILSAVSRVVREPYSVSTRMAVGRMFEERELHRLALEQFTMAADLQGRSPQGPARG